MSAVVKIDKLTWEAVGRYGSAAEAARANGVHGFEVRNMARWRSMPSGRWVYRREEDYDPAQGVPSGRNAPVDVLDERTGRAYRVPSVSWLASELGVSYGAANRALRRGWLLDGRFRVSRPWEEGR